MDRRSPQPRDFPADRQLAVIVHSTATGVVTDPVRTVLDCAGLSFGAGLAVADSALLHRQVEQVASVTAAEGLGSRCAVLHVGTNGGASGQVERDRDPADP